MDTKKCIGVNFRDGLGIFDDHYKYPLIDDRELHNGPTGKVRDIQGPQAHAGRNFFVPEGTSLSIAIDECPNFHVAIRADEGTNTCLLLCVHDKKPREHVWRPVVIGKTLDGDPGIYDVVRDCFEIRDDGEWHEYEFDLRKIREKQDGEYPYYPDAGRVCMVQFYSWSGRGENTFHFNDLLFNLQSEQVDEKVTEFSVSGLVSQDGQPLPNAMVRAYDRDMRSEELLGETNTDKNGHYEISYTAKKFRRAEKGNADLRVCVCDKDGKEIVSSDTLFNAPPIATINLTIGVEYRGPSEYEQLLKTLTPLLENVPLYELTKDDITFLKNDTGIDTRLITWLCDASKLERETDTEVSQSSKIKMHSDKESARCTPFIPAQIFYAWLRQKIPANLTDILSKDLELLRSALETSGRENVITSLSDNSLEEMMARVQTLKINRILKPAAKDARSSIGDLLSIALPIDKHPVVASAIIEYGRDTDAFWKSLENNKDLNPEDVDIVRKIFDLAELSEDHTPLMRELYKMGQENKEFAQLRGFAKFDENDWGEILKRTEKISSSKSKPIGYPSGYKTLEAYASALNQFIERKFTTATIANRIERDNDPQSPMKELKSDLIVFFSNNPNFDFHGTPVSIYLQDGKDGKLGGVDKPVETTAMLKSLERLSKITPRYEIARTLLADNLHSSQSIVLLGKVEFKKRYTLLFEGEENTTNAFTQAQNISIGAWSMYLKLSAFAQRPWPGIFRSSPPDTVNTSLFSEQDKATWTTLFGSIDLCDCEHCQSLYGPSAYFFDTLIFLKKAAQTGGKTALDVLLQRRPDLAFIELSCDNTNNKLPYVDLVNEILENAVASARFTVRGTFSYQNFNRGIIPPEINTTLKLTSKAQMVDEIQDYSWAIRDQGWRHVFGLLNPHTIMGHSFPQSTATEAELGANPEHTNTNAYDQLRMAVYPWSLPYNRWLEEARVYINHLGVQYHEVMETFFKGIPSAALTDFSISREYLELTSEESKIIDDTTKGGPMATTASPRPWDFWGLSDITGNYIPDPADRTQIVSVDWPLGERVDIFLQQSGLNFKELLELLGTYFINPVNSDGIRPLSLKSIDPTEAATCNLSKLMIAGLDAGGTILSKIHRFVRLYRKLGWTIRDLDKAITALEPSDLSDDFLAQLSHIQRLHTDLNVPVVNILSWWANIDTASYIDHLAEGQIEVKSLYEQLFLNKAVINPEDSAFELNSTRTELKKPSAEDNHVTINSHIPVVTAALGISAADLSVLLRFMQSIPQQEVTEVTDGLGVDRTGYLEPVFLLDLGTVSGTNSGFTIIFQESDDDLRYNDILNGDLQGGGQPGVIDRTNDDQLIRCHYLGTKKFLRVKVTTIQGISPSLSISAQILLSNDKVSDEMNLANLSMLYRISSLAKALNLSISDLLTVKALTEIDPFTTTEATLSFAKKVGVIRSSSFSINELDYLLMHNFMPSSGILPAEDAVTLILKDIRTGLQKIAAENIFSEDPEDPGGMTTDPRGELTSKKLALLNWDSALIGQVVATLSDAVTYETLTDPLPGLKLPNDTGTYEVKLKSLPNGFIFPGELNGIVTSEAKFLFACDSMIPIESSTPGIISAELHDQFSSQSIILDSDAEVTTEQPGINWKINGEYSVEKNGGILKIYETKLRAFRFLSEPERVILRNAAASSHDYGLINATKSLIELQDQLQGKITYEEITVNGQPRGRLRFMGSMTRVRKTQLDSVSFGPDSDEKVRAYLDAVQALFNAPRWFILRNMRTFSVQDFAADLNNLPGHVEFPKALKSKVYFDSVAEPKKLHFIGAMTQQQRDVLLKLSDDPADSEHTHYQDAVQTLFALSNADFEVELAELPASVEFPDLLKEKSYIDTSVNPKQLHFIGTMTEEEREILLNLSTDSSDPNHRHYQDAIRTLFTRSNSFVAESGDNFLAVSGQENDITAMLDNPTTHESRFLSILRKLMPYLQRTLSERLVTQKIAETLKLETKTAGDLLTKWPVPPRQKSITEFLAPIFIQSNLKVTPIAFPDQFKTFTLLHKIAMVVIKFKITHDQLTWLFDYGPYVGWLNLNNLPFARTSSSSVLFGGWERLFDLFLLRDQLPLGESVLSDVFSMARDKTLTSATLLQKQAVFLKMLSDHTGWSLNDLQFLVGAQCFGYIFPDAYKDERALVRFQACFKLMKRLGASAEQLSEWGKANQTPAEELANASSIKNAVKAKYDDKEWLTVAKPLKDPLREKQRAALVVYLITHPVKDPNNVLLWHDVIELYEYFLIDVEMSPCMQTTRIKQATSSVQLFIQRCLMNLEPQVALSIEDSKEWNQWRKLYRVWEANRKIFLYPENWIEPQLRDDKSPFFQELESELLQSDLTLNSAEDAFLHYLEKLDQVSRLEICGMYIQESTGPDDKTVLHVFGRTYAVNHIYYYRRLVDGVWSAWEKVDADIEGDHLIPIFWNRRLYLFWAIFTQKTKQQTKAERTNDDDPINYWEIKMAWCEYKNGKWSSKKMSKEPLTHPTYPEYESPDPLDFSFKTRIMQGSYGDQLGIRCYGPGMVNTEIWRVKFERMYGFGEFTLDEAHGDLKPQYVAGTESGNNVYPTKLDPLGNLIFQGMTMIGLDKAVSVWQYGIRNPNYMLLTVPANSFRLLIPHQINKIFPPIFYQDEFGTYLITLLPDITNLFMNFYNPFISHFIRLLNHFGINGLLSFPNRRIKFGSNSYYIGSTQWFVGQYSNAIKTERISCYVFDSQEPSTVPLYSVFHPESQATFLTTDLTEVDAKINQYSYSQWKRLCYVFNSQVQGTLPLYGLTLLTFQNHLYTTSIAERDIAVSAYGYKYDGIVCYVFDSKVAGTLGLERGINPQAIFQQKYSPTLNVSRPYPVENVDFEYNGAYSLYNWELFFHAPYMIATELSRNQRFEEAQKWFHYIFDPTSTEPGGRERFWKVEPFYQEACKTPQTLEEFLKEQSEEFRKQAERWMADPFQPHVIARMRLLAYMKVVVMKYIDNLIAWGDQLFKRYTIESINEATQLYLLAARILGKQPESIPARAKPKVQTFNTLNVNGELSPFANPMVEIESFIPPSSPPANIPPVNGIESLSTMPLFCLPQNEKLLGYWGTVADRLFKIRHCMNIEGVESELPIYEPKIDPGLMARAAAAGIDLDSVLGDMNAPLPHYRFTVMLQKATELCMDLKSLGSALLSALEKKDAEQLAMLRSSQELDLLNAVLQIKKQQIEEARNTLNGLSKYQDVVTARQEFYLSRSPLSSFEANHLIMTGISLIPMMLQCGAEVAAAVLHLVPNAKGGAPTTLGLTYGGENIASASQAFGSAAGTTASIMHTMASQSATLGSYQRRQEEWTHQADLATKELKQVSKQIIAAEIRVAIAESELQNHDLQIKNSQKVDEHMREKYTNQELYSWMVGQISGIFFQSYQIAYDIAKRAENAYRYELGISDSNFIQFGYWDSLKKGLLAGEKLHYDIKLMDVAYLDQNKREYEITKLVSMALLDPIALLELKETGKCFLDLPEALFDMDYPGHYMRRIKSVSITIPCVTGPYTSVNCMLTLVKSSIRKNTSPGSQYTRNTDNGVPVDDPRFVDSFGTIQSIVTSSAQNDSGMFETNFRDERYLHFEGTGVISTWCIELPADVRQFDYDTISDVILHLRYTSREGGEPFKQQSALALQTALKEFIRSEGKNGLVRAFSLRHEFPTEWHRFLNPPPGSTGNQTLTMALTKERFPFLFQDKEINITDIELFVKVKPEFISSHNENTVKLTLEAGATAPTSETAKSEDILELAMWNGLLNMSKSFNKSPGKFTLNAWVNTDGRLDPNAIQDILVVCRYTFTSIPRT